MNKEQALNRIKEIEKELRELKLHIKNEPKEPKVGDLVKILNPRKKQETTAVGARAAVVRGLKVLTSPDEGGTKQHYEDFLEKICNHVIISWHFGKDVGHVIKHGKDPAINEPADLEPADEAKKWKVRLWERDVDQYGNRMDSLKGNKEALYALIIESLSPMVKSKLKGKQGFAKAEEETDPLWLLNQLEDIMVRFEEVKPKLLAIDDQMHRIMNLRQGETTNEEFVKLVSKELKVYEKHGGDFLWGKKQKKDLEERLKASLEKYLDLNGTIMADDMIEEQTKMLKKQLHEEIIATAIIKRADKRRYGNLQIQMKNNFLMGNNMYPINVADVLRILDNYEREWPMAKNSDIKPEPNGKKTGVVFFQNNGDVKVTHMRGSNNSFFPAITCRVCGIRGHYQSHCPVCSESGEKVAEKDREAADAAVKE